VDAYRRSVAPMRARYIELLGGWPPAEDRLKAVQPRVEPIELTDKQYHFTAKRVWMPAWKGVDVYGILLEPRDIPSGERRPAVIAQHGYGGFPEAACGLVEMPGTEYLRAFGRTLAERGYVVFAPLVMHSDLNRLKKLPVIDRTWLDRLAMMVGCHLQAWEIFKITRVVDFLQTLPNVRGDRVAIMGISQGGMTALLAAAMDERIAACVSSGYFNNRTHKMVEPSPHYTAYIGTVEADKFFRGHLLAFEDADVASLICPRPFCVEVGRKDPVTWWPDVQAEFKRAREHWARLGVAERTAWALHEQQHVVDGAEAFQFLDRWLK
jgi:dienelactone hydrolase